MAWEYAEANVFGHDVGDYAMSVNALVHFLKDAPARGPSDAHAQSRSGGRIIAAEPLLSDAIGCTDRATVVSVWLQRMLRSMVPDLFAPMAHPKAEAQVAAPCRRSGKAETDRVFLDAMTRAMQRLAEYAHPAFPVAVFSADQQPCD